MTKFANTLLLIGVLLVSYTECESKLDHSSKNVAIRSDGPRSGGGCNCQPSRSDITICASNGILYANQCAFECAVKKVPRLKPVKNGSCNGLSRNDFYKATTVN